MDNTKLKDKGSDMLYGLNDRPRAGELIVCAFQYLVIFLGITMVAPMVVGGAVEFDGATITFLIQCSIFSAGIATFVQAFGIGPVGSKLPILMGATFVAVGPAISITFQYGYDSFIGATLVGSIVYCLFGIVGIKAIRKVFTPLISGAVVMSIGIVLMSISAGYMAGGDAPIGEYGSWQNYMLAAITLITCIIFNRFGKGFFKAAAVVMGIIVGYIISLIMGVVDFSAVGEAGWFAVPKPFALGISFDLQPILFMIVIYLCTMVEFIGDTAATTMAAADRMATDKEYKGGIACDALSSTFASIFNFLPVVSFGAGIGVISVTGVASRFVVALSGIFILIAGLFPKLSAVLYTVPVAVLGGATLMLFGMVTVTGIKIILQDKLDARNSLILAVSMAVGLGFSTSGVLDGAPMAVSALLSGVPGVAITGGILNLIIPKDKKEAEPVSDTKSD